MKINYLFNNQLLKIITFDRIGMHYLGYVQPLTGLWVAVGNHLRATDMEALTGLRADGLTREGCTATCYRYGSPDGLGRDVGT